MKFLDKLINKQPDIEKTDVPKRFELIGRVGQGSMSKVWRANDTISNNVIALKVLDKVKTKRLESRFVGLNKPIEGEIAMTLDHRNIVRTYEHGWTTNDEQFLIMEFVEGVGLSFLVDVQNETMKKHRLDFIIQLGNAIQYFHEENWIHRDICPRNVMVSDRNIVKLIDFGLVVPNTPDFRKPGNRTGTANYMAPELIKRQRTDQRLDVFSFAVTCYEMFTKQLPWESGETFEAVLQHINQPPIDIRLHEPNILDPVADTIMRGLEVRPEDRWSSVEDMLEQFEEVQDEGIGGLKIKKKKPSKSSKSRSSSRSSRSSKSKSASASKKSRLAKRASVEQAPKIPTAEEVKDAQKSEARRRRNAEQRIYEKISDESAETESPVTPQGRRRPKRKSDGNKSREERRAERQARRKARKTRSEQPTNGIPEDEEAKIGGIDWEEGESVLIDESAEFYAATLGKNEPEDDDPLMQGISVEDDEQDGIEVESDGDEQLDLADEDDEHIAIEEEDDDYELTQGIEVEEDDDDDALTDGIEVEEDDDDALMEGIEVEDDDELLEGIEVE